MPGLRFVAKIFMLSAFTVALLMPADPVPVRAGTEPCSALKTIRRTYDAVSVPLDRSMIQTLFVDDQKKPVSHLGLYRCDRGKAHMRAPTFVLVRTCSDESVPCHALQGSRRGHRRNRPQRRCSEG